MKLKRDLKLRKVGSRYMIVDSQCEVADFAAVYTLNEVAAQLWQKAGEGEFQVETLADWLCREYEVDAVQAEKDVQLLLSQWKEYGFVDE